MRLLMYEDSLRGLEDEEQPIIFLCGPTVRGNQGHLTSWRPAAIEEFERQGFEGVLVSPEFHDKFESDKGKQWIPRWEFNGLKVADAIMFWVPRTRELIGLTTNHEHGRWLGNSLEKVAYGHPEDAFRMDYLDIMWQVEHEELGYPVRTIYRHLSDTVAGSIVLAKSLFAEKKALLEDGEAFGTVRPLPKGSYTNPYHPNE